MTKTLNILVFHDGRPGHLNQLEGLVRQLCVHENCKVHWVDVRQTRLTLLHFFGLPKALDNGTKPDMIIGAGHRTHLSVLIAGFKYKAFTSLIMKPSIPTYCFNAVICPAHDGLKNSKKVFNTFGPVNNIDQNQLKKLHSQKTKNLILIGGTSKHYYFSEEDIINEIKKICSSNPDQQWLLSNSPRTPDAINQALANLSISNLQCYDYKNSDMGPLQDILLETRFAWITPDSMSMIFEALSARSQVGILHCEPKKSTRIVRQVDSLIANNYVFVSQHTLPNKKPKQQIPWEADRAAKWLIRQLNSV